MEQHAREAKLIQQSVRVLVVARRYSDGEIHPDKIFADLTDVAEYARYIYNTDEIVFVDVWGKVVPMPAHYSVYDTNKPTAIARAKHAKQPEGMMRPYVERQHQELLLVATEMATFTELDPPTCDARRVEPGLYVAGDGKYPTRFAISKERSYRSKPWWKVEDRVKLHTYNYHPTLDVAKEKINEILRREHTAAHIAKRCTSPRQ